MTEITETPVQITISELPELLQVKGTETLPIDSYNAEDEKQETLKVSVANIKSFILNGLEGSVTPEQIQAWDAKETTQGAQDKADDALSQAKEYTDTEVTLALEGLATTESVTQAVADKVDSDYLDLALADKADVAVEFVTVSEAYTIEEKDLGKVLFVTADVTLTISDQSALTEGFNCKIIKAEDTLTVGVELTGSDSIRGDIATVDGDVTLIKAPVAGKFLLV